MRAIAAAALYAALCSPSIAQDNALAIVPAPEAAQPPATTDLAIPTCTEGQLPKLTPVTLEILDNLGSKVSVTGQTFRFRLAEPVVQDGCEMLPTGLEGTGEVVHAKKASFGGSAGEFVAAARYLTVGDRQLRLRSLQLTLTGGDKILNAQLGAIGGLMNPDNNKKPNVEIPAGTLVMAKTAEAFDVVVPVSTDENVE